MASTGKNRFRNQDKYIYRITTIPTTESWCQAWDNMIASLLSHVSTPPLARLTATTCLNLPPLVFLLGRLGRGPQRAQAELIPLAQDAQRILSLDLRHLAPVGDS